MFIVVVPAPTPVLWWGKEVGYVSSHFYVSIQYGCYYCEFSDRPSPRGTELLSSNEFIRCIVFLLHKCFIRVYS